MRAHTGEEKQKAAPTRGGLLFIFRGSIICDSFSVFWVRVKLLADERLSNLMKQVSRKDGVAVEELDRMLSEYFASSRTKDEIEGYRLSSRPYKKLKDEVVVVNRFLVSSGITSGKTWFPLNSEVPDCWLQKLNTSQKIGIEVTSAMARARKRTMEQLVERGFGTGYLGLQDDATNEEEQRILSRARIMYAPNEAIGNMQRAISLSLKKKNKLKYKGMILLVGADMNRWHRERWDQMLPDLRDQAKDLPFAEVHIVAKGGEEDWCRQLR